MYSVSLHCVSDLVKGRVAVRAAVIVLAVRLTVQLLSVHLLLPQLVFLKFGD